MQWLAGNMAAYQLQPAFSRLRLLSPVIYRRAVLADHATCMDSLCKTLTRTRLGLHVDA